MRLQWLCIFLFVCLMSVTGIADDSSGLNTLDSQASNICKNRYAVNLELCGETISTADFFQRCQDDPTFCSPGNWGKTQEAQKAIEQPRVTSTAGTQTVRDGSGQDLGDDEIFEVLQTLYQDVYLTENGWETLDSTIWETFLGAFFGAFLGGLLAEIDDQTLAEIDAILADDTLWEMFDDVDEDLLTEILEPWEVYINPLVESDAFWVAFEEAFMDAMPDGRVVLVAPTSSNVIYDEVAELVDNADEINELGDTEDEIDELVVDADEINEFVDTEDELDEEVVIAEPVDYSIGGQLSVAAERLRENWNAAGVAEAMETIFQNVDGVAMVYVINPDGVIEAVYPDEFSAAIGDFIGRMPVGGILTKARELTTTDEYTSPREKITGYDVIQPIISSDDEYLGAIVAKFSS